MDQDTKDMVWTLAKITLVGSAIGIPAGVWAMKRWPDQRWKTALLLTAIGFGVKEAMLRGHDVQREEATVMAEEAMAAYANPSRRRRWGRPRRGSSSLNAYMPEPGEPPMPRVWYNNLKRMTNYRPIMRSGLNPTAL